MVLVILGQRQKLVRDVGKWKKEQAVPISDPEREAKIMERRLRLGAEVELDRPFIERIYDAIFEHSRAIQELV
jgi:chorismate mutase